MGLRLLAVGLLFSFSGFGSEAYCYFREVTLAGTTEKLTLQQPSDRTREVQLSGGSIYCSVACTVTMSRGGSAATATQTTATSVNIKASPPSVAVFVSSDAGAGVVLNKFVLAAGQTLLLDLKLMNLKGPLENINFTASAMTGDLKIFLLWIEQ